MIKMPYEQILEKLKTQSGISETELQLKIDTKMMQLSGLISKEGAAHIVANELGIKLFDVNIASGKLQIKNIMSGLRNVETVGKVIQKYDIKEFNSNGRQGKLATIVIADETGTMRVVMWNDQALNANDITEGMIVKVIGAYVRENNNALELHLNEKSKIILNPEGEKINVTASIPQRAFQRKNINDLQENDMNIELLGTIVQVFDPRFFEVCPSCGKRIKNEEGSFVCQIHNQVEPDFSYVANLIIDDGSNSIRAVFFKETMEKLMNKKKQDIIAMRSSGFDDVKNELLGNLLKVQGKAKKNLFFDRIEFMVSSLNLSPDPEDEIKKLNAAIDKEKNINL